MKWIVVLCSSLLFLALTGCQLKTKSTHPVVLHSTHAKTGIPGSSFRIEKESNVQGFSVQDLRPAIMQAISTELRGKGYQLSSDKADILVRFTGAVGKDIDLGPLNKVLPEPPTGDHTARQKTLPKGALAIFVLDAQKKQTLWQGTIQGHIAMDISPAERKKRVQKAISWLMKELPAKEKKEEVK